MERAADLPVEQAEPVVVEEEEVGFGAGGGGGGFG